MAEKHADINRYLSCAFIHLSKIEKEDPQHIYVQCTAKNELLLGKSNQNIFFADL